MIVITGAAGFIGSCLITKLNQEKRYDLVLVDDFSRENKKRNYQNKKYNELVDRNHFFTWLHHNCEKVDFIFHLGACSNTTETRKDIFDELNFSYSQKIFIACIQYEIPLVYASSAATYGMGEFGYDDDHSLVEKLKPLNLYGESKNDFDRWVLEREEEPPFWAGLKFFNVYGPNEYHKNRMASVVFHAFEQISNSNQMNLFKSHHPDYKDGMQLRDFIYVKDVVDVLYFLMQTQKQSGIYNLGTGKADTFLHLVHATFAAMNKVENIQFIDTPFDIREKYQYFTEAKMDKLIKEAGYTKPFTTLEEGVKDYVCNYLMKAEIY